MAHARRLRFLLAATIGLVALGFVAVATVLGGAKSERCTITGSKRADVLKGTAGKDVICGRGGNDRIDGRGGSDILRGGAGNDRLLGGAGSDELDGGSGNDVLVPGRGRARDRDRLGGGSGTDTADFSGSRKAVTVELDRRRAKGDGAAVLSSIARVTGSAKDDRLVGDARANVLRGGAGDDTLTGGAGDDTLEGGAGKDRIDGGPGRNRIVGGAGTDRISYASAGGGVVVDVPAGRATGAAADALAGVEDVLGSRNDDRLVGDSSRNTLDGGEGDDEIDGGAGDDAIDGGPGIDKASFASSQAGVTVAVSTGIARGAGEDRLASTEAVTGSPQADNLTGDEGPNTLDGGPGDDLLDGGPGDDRLVGGIGRDTATFALSANGVSVQLVSGVAKGYGDDNLAGVEDVVGTAGRDNLAGDDGDNRLDGADGDDVIAGGEGRNQLVGGGGRDSADFSIAKGDLRLDLSRGTATVGVAGFAPRPIASRFAARVSETIESDDLLSGFEDATGSPQNDTLIGDGTGNSLDGSGGNDRVQGGDGDDSVAGAAGSDLLFGENGDDRLDGGLGDDALDGGPGRNVCIGGGGNDAIDNNTCDAEPPQLLAFDFDPKSVDTSAAARTITITARITDDLSGNADTGAVSSVRFRGPSGQERLAFLNGSRRVSGTAQDGMYESGLVLPQFSEQGTWQLESVGLVDAVGNTHFMSRQEVADRGFPTSFTQTGAGDVTAPQLENFDFDPESVDTSAAPQTITFTAHITDDLSGNADTGAVSSVRFRGPSGQERLAFLNGSRRVSGTAQDGVYESDLVLPQFSEQGTWQLESVGLVDVAGNSHFMSRQEVADRGFPTSFTQTGAGDISAPQLEEFDFDPKSVDTSTAARTITVTARITDDLSGNAETGAVSSVRFRGPSGQERLAFLNGSRRVSGTAQDGIYESDLVLPQFSEQGTWQLESVGLVDAAGNSRFMSRQEVADLGFPTTFTNGPGP